jgi:hypothetical protein
MAKADCVFNTPPTNTSATRRHFLTIAAAGATALTLAPARAAASCRPDFLAAIKAHQNAYTTMDAVALLVAHQTGANGMADNGSSGLLTKNAAWSRIKPDKSGSKPCKATSPIAMVPQ